MDMLLDPTLDGRLEVLDWDEIAANLGQQGFARTPALLTADECVRLRSLYDHSERFRSRIIMARHGFGKGEYQYFSHPLPPIAAGLRYRLYERLAPTAREWAANIGIDYVFPENFEDFSSLCHEYGQRQPTPLILKYGLGDYNCLHQDIYGDVVFPIQAAIMLSDRCKDFTGGEFILTEQRPRMQSRCYSLSSGLGEMIIFATRHRPVRGNKRTYRVNIRHGVSPILSGERFTLGIIMHDAA